MHLHLASIDPRWALQAPALQALVDALDHSLQDAAPEAEVLNRLRPLLAQLVATDDWLPATHAVPHPQHYQQYPLYVDPQARFSVVSFVWGPGQVTPIHDHTVWGLIGMLRGAEYSQAYRLGSDGRPLAEGRALRLEPGHVEAVSPEVGDIHQVRNAYDDRVSISIHVYGADIGAVRRSVYREDGSRQDFISGYSTFPTSLVP